MQTRRVITRENAMNVRILIAVGALLASGPVAANCHWEWLCSGDGSQCKQMPICETLYDNPPPRPESNPPIPPIGVRPQKVSLGTGPETCEQVMHQTPAGKWEWDRACFCSDSTKAKDPNAPLANIVRCEVPWKE
jgi:hypothetical protein